MTYKEITKNELKRILPKKTKRYLLDNKWRLNNKNEITRFLRKNPIDQEKYIDEWHDCDDYAVRLWAASKQWIPGLCFGFLWIKKPSHIRNIFVDNDKKIWEIEPQTDTIKAFNPGNAFIIII